MVKDSQDILLDVSGIAQTVGLSEWHSPTSWNLCQGALLAHLSATLRQTMWAGCSAPYGERADVALSLTSTTRCGAG